MTNIFTRTAALGLTLAFGAMVPAQAQAPSARPGVPAASIVVVDIDRVVAESAAGKSLQGSLRPQAEQFQARQRALQEQFAKEEQGLQQAAQAKTLTQDVLETRARDVRQREQTAQTELAGRQRALETSRNTALQQIIDGMNPIVTALMRERGANLAVPRSGVMQMTAGLDVTPDVISRLDRALPRVNFTVPAATTKPPAR